MTCIFIRTASSTGLQEQSQESTNVKIFGAKDENPKQGISEERRLVKACCQAGCKFFSSNYDY